MYKGIYADQARKRTPVISGRQEGLVTRGAWKCICIISNVFTLFNSETILGIQF